ncbi:MAG: hypothetical protein KDD70_16370 [Bdellovibrionales bacterium]|nr:hypothetical protein [Bdellovibrionales bacterium]
MKHSKVSQNLRIHDYRVLGGRKVCLLASVDPCSFFSGRPNNEVSQVAERLVATLAHPSSDVWERALT